MSHRLFLIAITFGLLTVTDLSPCLAQSAGALIKTGNQAYTEQRYEDAINAYEEAAVSEPESSQIYFNKGTVRYKQGDYLQAIELFKQAAEKSRDIRQEAQSRYNIGNSYFRESERQNDSDLQKSVEALGKSIGSYQQTLELDPELTDAAHNIEIARLKMKQVLDEQKKQQEQAAEKQKQQEKAADKIKGLMDRQNDLAKESETLAERQQDKEITEKEVQKAQGKQDALKTETQKMQEQMAEQQNDPATENVQDYLKKAVSDQESAQEMLSQKNMDKAGKSQKSAAEELKKALENMKQQGQQDQQGQQQKQDGRQESQDMSDQGQQQQSGAPEPSQQESEQQTAIPVGEDAHDIINEEKESRDQRQLALPGNYKAVDKDW